MCVHVNLHVCTSEHVCVFIDVCTEQRITQPSHDPTISVVIKAEDSDLHTQIYNLSYEHGNPSTREKGEPLYTT